MTFRKLPSWRVAGLLAGFSLPPETRVGRLRLTASGPQRRTASGTVNP